ncbi:MAG: type II toxin-antitoxin system RelE/ParE family toxin [Candidatus Azotimanducaceae bacterium WSBS_2022_MAG_OTU7]
MIESFGNKLAEDLFYDKASKATRRFPNELRRIARRKLLYLHDAAELNDLCVPPENRLQVLTEDLKGFHSIRLNDQWRLIFNWHGGSPIEVQIIDYHR